MFQVPMLCVQPMKGVFTLAFHRVQLPNANTRTNTPGARHGVHERELGADPANNVKLGDRAALVGGGFVPQDGT
ncbi:hypothetical protein BC936DRAFT_142516 [Jimgerdemannia flammicorona]|uniref:Uncharacterized protein n=1 Tax=Jimgerdemannia flammicorona TaxID=994334 RepID=A0A433DF16_9FUNG|nr:hypothetical protein BC936DRAFT_142516 [Jimgerdemannia flammicorona]